MAQHAEDCKRMMPSDAGRLAVEALQSIRRRTQGQGADASPATAVADADAGGAGADAGDGSGADGAAESSQAE